MKTSFLKSLDGTLYGTSCWFASLLPKKPGELSEKALIIRPGGMGDLICADIALQELGLDSRHFTWLIEQRAQPWAAYRELPHCCYDENPLATLRGVYGQFPLVINTEQHFGLTEAYALLARTKKGHIVSFATNRGSRWSNSAVPYDWRYEHETLAFARLFIRALEKPEAKSFRLPRARVSPPDRPPLVLIAGRQSPSRRLEMETWSSLLSKWHRDRPFLIAAAPEDATFADSLVQRFTGLARCFEGSFPELCEQIAKSEAIFTVDGGAVHIASFFGVPTLALFTSGRDSKWHPLGKGSSLLRRRDLTCQPCTKFGQVPPCPYRYTCLDLENLSPVPIWQPDISSRK